MNEFVAQIGRHGYLVVFGVVFAEAIGLPVPAAIALVAGGAAAASGVLSPMAVLFTAVAAMMLGDVLLYVAGQKMGWGLLGLLCKVSVNPETCILRSAESFYKRGKLTLLIAKFIPGINTMAPPLAGSMKMQFAQFFQFDLAGAALYALAYGALGFMFRDFLAAITRGFQAAGRAVEISLVAAVAVYVVYRVWLYRKHRVYRVVPRVQVQELARTMESEEVVNIVLADVRSHGYYDAGTERIRGSIRLEPNNLSEELKNLPRDKNIYIYCT